MKSAILGKKGDRIVYGTRQSIRPLIGKRRGSVSVLISPRQSLNSSITLQASNRGTVNPPLYREESGPVLKPRTKRSRGGTTLLSVGFARTSFVTPRSDSTGIQSVLRLTNGSEPVVCCFAVFGPRSQKLRWPGQVFRISIGPIWLTPSLDR